MTHRHGPNADGSTSDLSRRAFLQSGGVATAATALGSEAVAQTGPAVVPAEGRAIVSLTLNGQARRVAVETGTTLVELLRDQIGVTGTKIGCNQGQCGACTVLMDGRPVNSCLTPALQAEGRDVVTVEGLAAPDGTLHPMQAAFADHDAFQCGFCTPGQILSAIACIEGGHAGTEEEIRDYMSGNLCRCGAYPNIVAAIVQARDGVEG